MYTETDTPRLYPESLGVLHACRRALFAPAKRAPLHVYSRLSYLHDPHSSAVGLDIGLARATSKSSLPKQSRPSHEVHSKASRTRLETCCNTLGPAYYERGMARL